MISRFARALTRRTIGSLLFCTFVACFTTSIATAQTVDEIKKRGVIRIGVFASEPPFGTINDKGEPIGLDIEVSKLVAREMGVKVEFERVINASRIPTLATGKVDLLIASLAMFPDRAKAVQFSRPYIAGVDIVIAERAKQIKSYADLKDLRIGASRGSNMDNNITKNVPSSTTVLRFDDDASAVTALMTKQVDAIGLGFFGLKKIKENAPDREFEEKFVMSRQWAGIGMRKGQADLNKWVNAFLDKIEASGELGAIVKEWMGLEKLEYPKSIPDVPFTTEG